MKIGIAAKLSALEWDMYKTGNKREEVVKSYLLQNKMLIRFWKAITGRR